MNKFSDTSNFNRSPLCLNALQIRCARVSQGTRTFACLFTTTTTVLAKSSRFSKDILPFHRPLAAFRFVLLIYFSPHDGSKRFLVKTIFREYVWRAQSRAFSSPPARTRDKRRGKTAVFLAEWKYRYEASVGMCVYVCEIRECTLRGGCNQRRGEDGRIDASVYLAFCLASEGGKGSYCWVAIVLDVVHIGAYLVFIFLKRIERDNGVIVLIIFV